MRACLVLLFIPHFGAQILYYTGVKLGTAGGVHSEWGIARRRLRLQTGATSLSTVGLRSEWRCPARAVCRRWPLYAVKIWM